MIDVKDIKSHDLLVPIDQVIRQQKQLVESHYWHGDDDQGQLAEQELNRLVDDYCRGIHWVPLF